MGNWVETYRGMVKAWEVDGFEHFTVAYYYNRLSDATMNLFAECGLGWEHMKSERHALASIASAVQFKAELRKGDVMHIESGVLGSDERGARIAHRLYNSATGELATQFELTLRYMDLDARRGAVLPESARARLEPFVVTWDGPTQSEYPAPTDESAFVVTAYDTVKPWEIDVLGHMSVEFYIHRFSDASNQTLTRIGMTPPYMRTNRVGFSTFEFQSKFYRELSAGDRVQTRSALVHVGNSSIRFLSRMYNIETGQLAAELSQYGVHLDLDARRPCRIPDAIREQGAALTATVSDA